MIYEFKDAVCHECGHNEIESHACEQMDNGMGERVWTTREDRRSNPKLVPLDIVHLLYVEDRTWITCFKCKTEIDPVFLIFLLKAADARWRNSDKGKAWEAQSEEYKKTHMPWTVTYEMGPVIVSDYKIFN